jgi:sugar lactone lactonase YvrE
VSAGPRCIWPLEAELGEGPLWDARTGRLRFVDIKGRRVLSCDRDGGTRRETGFDRQPGCLGLTADPERLLCAFDDGFHFIREGEAARDFIADPEPNRPGNRFNDGKVGPDGAFWAGSMDDEESKHTGSFYRLAPGGGFRAVDSGYHITNGPAFAADGATIYLTDTPRKTIYAADLTPDGGIANRRVHVTVGEDDGYPDGMTVDAEGGLWVAFWGGWGVARFDASGRRGEEIRLPVAQTTSVAFGGPELATLYITSARKGLTPEALAGQPLAGGLFSVDAGRRGRPEPLFTGGEELVNG